MELLGRSCNQIIADNNYIGLPLSFIQNVMKSVLEVLIKLQSIRVIHGDIKPENILQTLENPNKFKLIDFGLCVLETDRFKHIQTIYYKAPEVLFNTNITCKADIWSLGCVACELFFGIPLFPFETNVTIIYYINKLVGPYPEKFIRSIRHSYEYFTKDLKLKKFSRLCNENNENFPKHHPFFAYKRLGDNLFTYSDEENGNGLEISGKEKNERQLFLEFVLKMLKIDPDERPNADILMNDPFLKYNFG